MLYIPTATQAELEGAIIADDELYATFDEQRLLNGGYTTEELREAVQNWIESGDECAAA